MIERETGLARQGEVVERGIEQSLTSALRRPWTRAYSLGITFRDCWLDSRETIAHKENAVDK